MAGRAATTGTSTRNTEPRPASEFKRDRMLEHAADALDDGEAEAQAPRDLRALIEALELAEDDALLRGRNAEAGIPDLENEMRAAPARADEHAARRRVLDGVGDQVLQQAAHEPPVGAHRQRGGRRR